jgi:hypothetical protein
MGSFLQLHDARLSEQLIYHQIPPNGKRNVADTTTFDMRSPVGDAHGVAASTQPFHGRLMVGLSRDLDRSVDATASLYELESLSLSLTGQRYAPNVDVVTSQL